MFDKIYERLRLVSNIELTDEEKSEFEHKCFEIASCGYGISEVVNSVYFFISRGYSVINALNSADYH